MKNEAIPRLRFRGFNDKWNEFKLGQLMKVSSSKRVHKNEWTNTGIRFLRARDIVANKNHVNITDPLFISPDTYYKYAKVSGVPKSGDLLVTGVGTVGVPLLIKSNKPFYFKDGNIIWFHNHKLGKYFLYYYFLTNKFKKYMKSITGVGTVATYTITAGRNTPINIPSLVEQQQIGIFFAALDQLIQLQQKKVTLLKRLKKAYLQKLFPRKGETIPRIRFKGFRSKYIIITLGQIVTWTRGKQLLKSVINTKGIGNPIVHYADLYKFAPVQNYVFHWSTSNQGTLIPLNSLLFPMSDVTPDGLATTTTITLKHVRAGRNISIGTLKNTDKYIASYLSFEINSRPYKILRLVTGTTVMQIYPNALSTIKLSVPATTNEQRKVSRSFLIIDKLISMQHNKVILLNQLKKAYLQKMFC